ncbi:MAG: hypothetical protein EKK49_05985 [Rhodocyclaceae bacterium]|nr:MAG: hypothetical protein EKK49_05985 [Rhodocyclaceae bacterium]
MSHLRLPAGTDVAEMALFDVDALPQSNKPNESTVATLAESKHLIRFPTGADGAYLLHLFVDESVPQEVQRYCLAEDKLVGTFTTEKGNIAFGGIESTSSGFKPNRNIRSDGTITPGNYSYTAFHTEFPDEMVTHALQVEKTPGELWLSRSPVLLVLSTIAIGVSLAVSQRFLEAGGAFLIGYFGVQWLRRIPAYQSVAARRDAAQLEFPSIVVEMRSSPSINQTSNGLCPSDASYVKR